MTELIIWNSWAKRELVPKLNKRSVEEVEKERI